MKRTHSDQTYEAFRYREDGLLEEALTPATRVRWERDALGRVVKEHQGNHWVAFRYGPSGDRVEMMSSLGSTTLTPRDLSGKITSISVQASGSIAPDPIWQIDLARDTAGAELERRAPGGLRARTHYDEVGRPASQRVTGPGGALLAELEYRWEPDERLAALNDPATGLTSFTYDARGRLSAAVHADGRIEHRAADPAGNLYRHPERRGRHYTSGGALRDAEGTRYTYDADGSLTEKVEPSGARWSYSWDGAGNLKEVSRPDGQKVSFDYDGLGRRIRKHTAHGVTTWLWSGDVPLHEIGQDRQLITWVFEPESFTPVGKIQADRGYTIVSDHLGTPRAMFDEEGQIAWRAQLDVWGACRTDVMTASCPWRWPGQYEDEETGLYYNRFRYYDPRAGRYISKDPIGLAGGLNAYAYVADPNGSADPLGLARKKVCKDTGPQLEANIEAQLKAAGISILKQNHPVFDAGIKRGEIDFEVPEAIIEATVSPSGKLDQITKYLTNPSLFNPSNKPIILFAPNYGGAAGRDIENLGVLVVRDYANLLALVK